MQEKLLLTALPGGGWGRPVDGTPSTHIIKPEIRGYPNTVENEAFCMRVAQSLGLPAAHVETTEIQRRPLLVVQRYDRLISANGHVERIHQEDFCQALGISPRGKYEENGGPSLRKIASVLEAVAPPEDRDTLLRFVALNAVLGNGDAHGKNFSLLHRESGALRLSPLYDVLCTTLYGEQRSAMYIDGVQRMDRVTADRVINEGVSWGLPRANAEGIVRDIVARFPQAIEIAADRVPNVPPKLIETVQNQLRRMVVSADK